MTKDKALRLLERHVDVFSETFGAQGDLREALEALRPKPRKVSGPLVSPAVRDGLKALRRPAEFGLLNDAATIGRYLDTFGAGDSPEREAQRVRLAAMQDGPSRQEYGAPEEPAWRTPDGMGLPWVEHDRLRRAHDAALAVWRSTPDGARFAADLARHEARARHFAYTGPRKSAKPDELATYVRAFLADDVLQPGLPVAA